MVALESLASCEVLFVMLLKFQESWGGPTKMKTEQSTTFYESLIYPPQVIPRHQRSSLDVGLDHFNGLPAQRVGKESR